jgi:hypothetical protein
VSFFTFSATLLLQRCQQLFHCHGAKRKGKPFKTRKRTLSVTSVGVPYHKNKEQALLQHLQHSSFTFLLIISYYSSNHSSIWSHHFKDFPILVKGQKNLFTVYSKMMHLKWNGCESNPSIAT